MSHAWDQYDEVGKGWRLADKLSSIVLLFMNQVPYSCDAQNNILIAQMRHIILDIHTARQFAKFQFQCVSCKVGSDEFARR